MGLVSDIFATYRSPRNVMRRLLAVSPDESRALMYLLLACGLAFVAQWPRLQREALMDASVTLEMRIGGALLGWMFMVPPVMYAVAFAARLIARAFGGQGTGYSARLALFWSMLATAPLGLAAGLISGFGGAGIGATVMGVVGYAVFCLIWFSSMIEAELGGARQ